MNQGPVIFLGVFFALVLSWFGLILQPQLQLGGAQPAADLYNPEATHPVARTGLAQRGLEVYRSLGCATCHTQQIQQQGTVFDVVLATPGTNVAEVIKAILHLRPDLTAPEAARLVDRVPVEILGHVDDLRRVQAAVAQLSTGNARVETHLVPVGPDIARGWGVARSVGSDSLHDYPVMLGSQRIGPDLANVGAWPRTPDWYLRLLYDPTSVIPKSVMPPYRFLFEKRPIAFQGGGTTRVPRVDAGVSVIAGTRTNWALPATSEGNAGSDEDTAYEIVPTEDARALIAYLMSLRADTAILERPLTGAVPTPVEPHQVASALSSTVTELPVP